MKNLIFKLEFERNKVKRESIFDRIVLSIVQQNVCLQRVIFQIDKCDIYMSGIVGDQEKIGRLWLENEYYLIQGLFID